MTKTKLRTEDDIIDANEAMFDAIGDTIPVPVARERNRLIRNQLTALSQKEQKLSRTLSEPVRRVA